MDILGRKESKSAKRFGVTKETVLVHPAVLRTGDEISKWLEENKHLLNYPEATLGDEPGSFHKDWESPSFKLCLVAWNGYTQLMGSLTLPMLYRMLNEAYPGGICERAFFPNDPKEMAIYEKNGLPIFSVESKHSIADFDVVGFSVAVTGMDLNVIKMLNTSGIPVRAKDRPLGKYPLIIRGGVSSGNLSPIGAFYDVCFVGEAEAGFVEILDHIRVLREKGVEKKELLLELANSHNGIYIPAFYKEQFDPETKRLTGWKVMSGAPKEVKRAYIKDVNKAYVYKHPVIHYSGKMGLGEGLISRSCFEYNSKVLVADGTFRKIGEIVAKKQRVKVACLDERGKFKFEPVVNWHNNGKGEFISVRLKHRAISCTPDHLIKTPSGWICASELAIGDRVCTRSLELQAFQKSILLGSVLGDGSVSHFNHGRRSAIRILQRVDKKEHNELFNRLMAPFAKKPTLYRKEGYKDIYVVTVSGSDEIDNLAELTTKEGKKFVREEWFKDVDELALAVWYMHDGSIGNCDCARLAINALSEEELFVIEKGMLEKWGIELRRTPGDPGTVLWMRKYDAAKFFWLVAPFILKEFEYKIPTWARHIKKYKWRECQIKPHSVLSTSVVVAKKSLYNGHPRQRYDLTIAENHNYVVSDVVVHNCSNSCSFCNESLVTKPYREYSPDVAVDMLKTNMAESGSDGVLPAGFCLSTHSQRTTIIKRLYEEVSDDVKLISQRVDDFASDPGFVTLSRKAGNMGVSLGVEGLSGRLRRLVNKNITTQQIIDASVNAMTAGYSKIKYFMLAGLPGETQEDRDEFLLLAERIAAEREKLGSKCRLQFNWTTISIVDHSPFQWFKPNIETRTLHAVLHRLKELGIRAGFGASKTPDSDFYGQLMFIGDSRLSSIIEDLALKFGCVYFRGIKKGTKDFIVGQLSEVGLSEELWFREKDEDELFPWDVIDFGIKKSFLLKRYRECKEGISWASCKEKCSGCGACDKEDQKHMQLIRNNEDIHLTSKEALSIVPVRQKGTVQRYLFRIVQEKSHRYLSAVVKRMIIRRALYQCGLPTTKDIGISSATPPLEAWIYGVDYVDIPFHIHSYGMLDRIKEVDKHLVGMRLDRTLRLPPSAGAIRSNFDSCLYSLGANVSISELRERVQMLLDASPITDNLEEVPGKQRTAFIRDHIGVVRVKVPANRGGVDQMLVDVRPMVRNLLVVEQEGGVQFLAELTGFINIYHVYRAMTNRPWREILGMDGFRLEFFASSMPDLFSRKCSVCKALIRKNLFDEFYGMCVVCGNPVQ